MRMKTKVMRRIGFETDFDSVPDLCPYEWSEDAEVRPCIGTRLKCPEAAVGVLPENGFAINGDVRIQGSFGSGIILKVISLAVDQVLAGRGIIPVHFIGGNVVGADSFGGGGPLLLREYKPAHQHRDANQRNLSQNPHQGRV